MADEHWMDALNDDPDLTPSETDDVDALIQSTLQELEHADRMMGDAEAPDPADVPPEPQPQPFLEMLRTLVRVISRQTMRQYFWRKIKTL